MKDHSKSIDDPPNLCMSTALQDHDHVALFDIKVCQLDMHFLISQDTVRELF